MFSRMACSWARGWRGGRASEAPRAHERIENRFQAITSRQAAPLFQRDLIPLHQDIGPSHEGTEAQVCSALRLRRGDTGYNS